MKQKLQDIRNSLMAVHIGSCSLLLWMFTMLNMNL